MSLSSVKTLSTWRNGHTISSRDAMHVHQNFNLLLQVARHGVRHAVAKRRGAERRTALHRD